MSRTIPLCILLWTQVLIPCRAAPQPPKPNPSLTAADYLAPWVILASAPADSGGFSPRAFWPLPDRETENRGPSGHCSMIMLATGIVFQPFTSYFVPHISSRPQKNLERICP